MRLVYAEERIEINLSDSRPVVFIIEKPEVFSKIVEALGKQINGEEGSLLLSEDEKKIKIDKKVEFIVNPFSINCNDRKILNKIYAEATNVALDEYFVEMSEINAKIIEYIEDVSQKLSYNMTFDLELDTAGLWKLYNMKIDEDCSEPLEYLITYIRLLHQVNSVVLFVFLNLKQYFSMDQLSLLYQACEYEHVCVLDLEGYDTGNRNPIEKYMICDKDLCIININ